jgi:hypothetical protein
MAKSDEIGKKIIATLPDFRKLARNIELLSAQKAQELLLGRVYSGGEGAKDTKGKALSPYSTAYAKKREKAGRQVEKKDLLFTGALFESIQIGTEDEIPTLGFLTQYGADVSGYQEEQNKTSIFSLNDEERKQIKDTVSAYVQNSLKDIVRKWS